MADKLVIAIGLERAITAAVVISGLNILVLVIFLLEQVVVNRDQSLASVHQYHRKAILDSMLLDEKLAYQEVYLGLTMAFMAFFDLIADQ